MEEENLICIYFVHLTDVCRMFCAEAPSRGVHTKVSRTSVEKDKLTIKVYLKVVEVVHQGKSTENEILDYNGLQILACQAYSFDKIFAQHPGFAPKKHGVDTTAHTTLLLGLIETLRNSPQSLSATELSRAQNASSSTG
ncbi:unnamed protein product [Thlaspi arvense]|uniref:Uncharacterized protein n=1 Tax=Thlaspi arvense TaxID=13288 RepID=A0AAU9RJT5_THLAR|nr:unnamed protein product [Thlaspi arvense]